MGIPLSIWQVRRSQQSLHQVQVTELELWVRPLCLDIPTHPNIMRWIRWSSIIAVGILLSIWQVRRSQQSLHQVQVTELELWVRPLCLDIPTHPNIMRWIRWSSHYCSGNSSVHLASKKIPAVTTPSPSDRAGVVGVPFVPGHTDTPKHYAVDPMVLTLLQWEFLCPSGK